MSRHEDYMKLMEEREKAGKEAYSGNVLDMVNNPPHYNQTGIEGILIIHY